MQLLLLNTEQHFGYVAVYHSTLHQVSTEPDTRKHEHVGWHFSAPKAFAVGGHGGKPQKTSAQLRYAVLQGCDQY